MSLSITLSLVILASLGDLNWVHVIEGVKVLAHDQSLSPLDGLLLLGKWGEQNWNDDQVAESPELPGWEDSRSSDVSEETLLDVEHVECCEEGSEEGGGGEQTLRVVHSVDDSLVLFPIVVIHC